MIQSLCIISVEFDGCLLEPIICSSEPKPYALLGDSDVMSWVNDRAKEPPESLCYNPTSPKSYNYKYMIPV